MEEISRACVLFSKTRKCFSVKGEVTLLTHHVVPTQKVLKMQWKRPKNTELYLPFWKCQTLRHGAGIFDDGISA